MLNPKISVIGCGYWGKNLVRNFAELGVLHSVCDTNQELSNQVAKTYAVNNLRLDEVLNSGCDGVVIASRYSSYRDISFANY